MAASHITKNIFAQSFKELLNSNSFDKISVSEICKKSGMNRKSFYYHFKDKYDLVNWIFETEFIDVYSVRQENEKLEVFSEMLRYFYENRGFYKKLLNVGGQNSFSDYFQELLFTEIKRRLQYIMDTQNVSEFQIYFIVDAVVCAVKRWITGGNCIPHAEFLKEMLSCVYMTANHITKNISELKLN